MGTLTEHREALHLSVSQIKTYLRCPRQFELKYVRGVEAAFLPVPLAFGIAFHAALAGYYETVQESGRPPALEDIEETFKAVWQDKADGPVPLLLDGADDAGTLQDRAVAMLSEFYEKAGQAKVQVEAVEVPFSIELQDPETGEILEEQLVGAMDLVVREGAGLVVVEHKTSARKWSADQLAYDLQPTAYKMAARQMGLGNVGVRFQIITKTKTPALQIEDVQRFKQDEEDFLRTAIGVLRAVEAGVSYPIRGWQCRSCQFQAACGG